MAGSIGNGDEKEMADMAGLCAGSDADGGEGKGGKRGELGNGDGDAAAVRGLSRPDYRLMKSLQTVGAATWRGVAWRGVIDTTGCFTYLFKYIKTSKWWWLWWLWWSSFTP